MGHLPHIPTTKSSLVTELLGSFLFVLIGTSALTALNIAGQATTATAILVGTLAFAGALGWLTYSFYRFPLPQFNPAVTILFWIQKLQPLSRSLMIILAQIIGAVAASVVVALLYGSAGVEVRLGAPYPATLMGEWSAVVAEFIGSMIAFYAVHTAMSRQRLSFLNPFLLISLGYALGYLFAAGISGGSLNPARALAPQLAAADLTGWWAYIIGPLAAATAIGLTTRQSASTQAEKAKDALLDKEQDLPASKPTQPAPPTPAPVAAEPNEDTPKYTEPEFSAELQQKAQQAISKFKDLGERPQLPFASLKPSFFPLKGKKTVQGNQSPSATTSVQPEEASESSPAATNPESANKETIPVEKTEVKFVKFAHNPLEENEG